MKTFTFVVDPQFSLKKALSPALKAGNQKNADHQKSSMHFIRSVETYQKLMTNTRYQVFFTIRDKKPESLYALAKILGKELSNLLKDVRVLESLGLIELEDVTTATGRAGQKPFAPYDEIDVKIKGTTLEDVA
jgi:predicted transcriptional regulator